MSASVRGGILLGLCASIVVGIGAAGIAQRIGPRARGRLDVVARCSVPLVILPVVPALLERPLWRGREVAFFVLLGAAGLVLEHSLWTPLALISNIGSPLSVRWFRHTALRTWVPRVLLALAVGWYCVVIGRDVLLCHARLATSSSDLAEFDNLFFNALHGHPFRAPAIAGDLANWSALSVHTEFLLYLLLPFYALRPGPETLLVIQTLIVALTALPIYLFAARHVGKGAGLVFAIVYLLLPAVEQPNFYDFHFTPLGMLCVATTIWLLDRALSLPPGRTRRPWLVGFGVAFVASLLSREDVATGVTIAGFLIAASGTAPRIGAFMTVLGGAYVAFVLWLKQHIGVSTFHLMYADLQLPGHEGLRSVVITLLTNPLFALTRVMTEPKLLYLLEMLVPLLFLWVRRWYLVLSILPAVLFTFAVTNRPQLTESSFQYTYLWVPYVMAASVIGLERLAADGGMAKRRAALIALAFVAVAVSIRGERCSARE